MTQLYTYVHSFFHIILHHVASQVIRCSSLGYTAESAPMGQNTDIHSFSPSSIESPFCFIVLDIVKNQPSKLECKLWLKSPGFHRRLSVCTIIYGHETWFCSWRVLEKDRIKFKDGRSKGYLFVMTGIK